MTRGETALLAGMSLALAVVASLPPATTDALRTAGVADLALPGLAYAHDARANSGTLTLSVSDDDIQGWHVTVSASDFAYSGPHDGSPIPAANLAITAAHPPVLASGQAVDATGGPKVPSASSTGPLDAPRKVLHADAGYGQGSYTQQLDVDLTVPARSRAGTYTTTLTTTITAGP